MQETIKADVRNKSNSWCFFIMTFSSSLLQGSWNPSVFTFHPSASKINVDSVLM